jgi:hypothetical protein
MCEPRYRRSLLKRHIGKAGPAIHDQPITSRRL